MMDAITFVTMRIDPVSVPIGCSEVGGEWVGRGWQEEAECSIRWREEISSQLMQVMDAQWPSFPVSGDGGGRWKRKWKAGRQRTCIIRPDSLLLPIPPRLQI